MHRTGGLCSVESHSNDDVASIRVAKLGVKVTYFGHGPPLEKVSPACDRDKHGSVPAGFLVKATDSTGDKDVVC